MMFTLYKVFDNIDAWMETSGVCQYIIFWALVAFVLAFVTEQAWRFLHPRPGEKSLALRAREWSDIAVGFITLACIALVGAVFMLGLGELVSRVIGRN